MDEKGKKKITRRDFMKKVGKGAVLASVAPILPRLAKPARAAERDHILIGRPLPITGPVSVFAENTPWLDDRAVDAINKDGGIYIEEYGKQLPIKVKILDTESNPTKAGELSARLILRDKVDLMYVSHTPATVAPTAANCERYKVPCVSTMNPVEMWLPGGPFHWSFDPSFSVKDFTASFVQMWPDVQTNNVVGLLAQNDVDGMAWADASNAVLKPMGYTIVDLGRFPIGSPDYTAFISGWKKEKVEIIFANMAPPDFATLWRQCFREGFIPKICTVGRATSYPSAVEALGGDLGLGTSSEAPWHPNWPFKSSLTGESARELANAWESFSGKQWSAPLGGALSGYEVVADALRRAKTLDKEKIRRAIADTKIETVQGPVKFGEDNAAVVPSAGLQWAKGDKWKYKCVLVANGNYKMIPTEGKLRSIRELREMS